MLTESQNRLLTEVTGDAPAGALLRRYWQPIAALSDLERAWVMPVRIFGEDLALFKTGSGELGLVDRRCPHRSASLVHGMAEEGALRCVYHGWSFDTKGQCLEQPYDDTHGGNSRKATLKINAYPVQSLGGLVWGYFGPEPVPLLPRWDILVEEGLVREIEITVLDCNFVQCMENTLDPVHVEWLHFENANYLAKQRGLPPFMEHRRHLKIAFDEHEFGITKRRLYEGASEDDPDWVVGHPLIFPNTLSVQGSFQFRVPMDDTHTLHINYTTRARAEDEPEQLSVPAVRIPFSNQEGDPVPDWVLGQDFMAWTDQGPIAPRESEVLSRSDAGIAMYRKMMFENIEKVQRGEDPKGIVRDQARNEPMIHLSRESHRFEPVFGTDVTKHLFAKT